MRQWQTSKMVIISRSDNHGIDDYPLVDGMMSHWLMVRNHETCSCSIVDRVHTGPWHRGPMVNNFQEMCVTTNREATVNT